MEEFQEPDLLKHKECMNFPHFLSRNSRIEKVRQKSNSPNSGLGITTQYILCALGQFYTVISQKRKTY